MNRLQDAREALRSRCSSFGAVLGKGGSGSTRKRFILALLIFFPAVLFMLVQGAWNDFPDWVKQQVSWNVLDVKGGDEDFYSPRRDRNQWWRIQNVPDARLPWKEQLVRNASYGWCDKMSCPYSRVLQQPSLTALWGSANASGNCPDYFKWIRQDLAPWSATGVTLENVLAARKFGHFRVTILKGKLYAEYYGDTFQTRGPFTLWGIAMLLEKYPGLVPDVDFVFSGGDWPTVPKADFRDPATAPFVFGYCNTLQHFNVPFPDWSFWGWPEVRIPPWDVVGREIFRAAEDKSWQDRENVAFWRGNSRVGILREKLLHCDVSQRPNSSVHIYEQDWGREFARGFKTSNLAGHCKYRYMIYAEGNAWSVSYKYIMACGSPVLAIDSQFYEFFTRSLQPSVHYLPVSTDRLCDSMDGKVKWANSHRPEANEMASKSFTFMKDMNIDTVYDYMLHLLQAYAKLLKYQPTVPPHAEELCPAKLLCSSDALAQVYLKMNSVPSRSASQPCMLQ